jgi:dTDP-4-dehydrorhamnose reductase
MTKILLVGKIGQLGWELQRSLPCLGEVHAVDYPEIDLRDEDAVRELVRAVLPEVIVNAAAYTDVNGAESNLELARAINGVAPGVLASELAAAGGRFIIHFSTDYVFNGEGNRPYVEDDSVDPINAYGLTKLEGEQAIARSGCAHIILRTQWLYAARGKNFLLTILRLAREGKPLRIVSDQVGAPTTARMLAELTSFVLSAARARAPNEFSGVYHATAAGQASWYDFTKEILEQTCSLFDRPPDWCRRALASLQPVPSSEYPAPARRPAYSVLSNEKLARVFGLRMPDWRHQLRFCLEELKPALPAE